MVVGVQDRVERPQSWVILELSHQGESEADIEVLRRSLQKSVGDRQIFIPSVVFRRHGQLERIDLMSGYVFVENGLAPDFYFGLEGLPYIKAVLSVPGRYKRISYLPDLEVQKMESQLHEILGADIQVDDEVRIIKGVYTNMMGMVMAVDDGEADIRFILRSFDSIVRLPLSYLEKSHDDSNFEFKKPESPDVLPDLPEIDLIPDFPDEEEISLVQKPNETAKKLWKMCWDQYEADPFTLQDAIDLAWASPQIDKESKDFGGWIRGLFHRYETATLIHTKQKGQRVCKKYLPSMFYRVDSGTFRCLTLKERQKTVRAARRIQAQRKKMKPSYLIFDGSNLLMRMHYIYDVKKGLNADGEPTGVYYGVLKSLTAMKKRFPYAQMIMVWDGGNQRRKKLYPGYKASRVGSVQELLDTRQGKALQATLSALGVWQAQMRGEEADDVIASLLSSLSSKVCVVVSSDQDFLQLVGGKVLVLAPKVGAHPETLYDSEKVEKKFSVPPKRLVAFRSFDGDKSDELPGVPGRIPRKVIASLVNDHDGDLAAVYEKGLKTVTARQREHLSKFREQAKLNYKLMGLVTDLEVLPNRGVVNLDLAKALLKRFQIKSMISSVDTFQAKGFVKTGGSK
jgi:5'-3' exonuclease/transcription antitermination factor NusG